MARLPRLVLASTFAAAILGAAAPAALACSAGGYTYAGIAGDDAVAGIGARVTPAASGFSILSGHVAGWVGVGGPGEGPNGADEWIQTGFSAFPDWTGNDLYYEVARPGLAPTYHRVAAGLAAGVGTRVAVLEMYGRRNWWRVWVNGAPASDPIYLPESHDRWRPIVTAESWDGGASSCNDFVYRFDGVSIARRPGGLWSPLLATTPIDDADTVVSRRAPGSFYAAGGDLGLRALASTAP